MTSSVRQFLTALRQHIEWVAGSGLGLQTFLADDNDTQYEEVLATAQIGGGMLSFRGYVNSLTVSQRWDLLMHEGGHLIGLRHDDDGMTRTSSRFATDCAS